MSFQMVEAMAPRQLKETTFEGAEVKGWAGMLSIRNVDGNPAGGHVYGPGKGINWQDGPLGRDGDDKYGDAAQRRLH